MEIKVLCAVLQDMFSPSDEQAVSGCASVWRRIWSGCRHSRCLQTADIEVAKTQLVQSHRESIGAVTLGISKRNAGESMVRISKLERETCVLVPVDTERTTVAERNLKMVPCFSWRLSSQTVDRLQRLSRFSMIITKRPE